MYQGKKNDQSFTPLLAKMGGTIGKDNINIFKDFPKAIVIDLFAGQKKELFKIRNTKVKLSPQELDALYDEWQADKIVDEEGVWAYYPWSDRLIHLLDKEEFIELRTTRNKYKITPIEQEILLSKSIGIIGLSVGNAVALSIATERICGKLKLADFDIIELSNLNRLKTGIHNIGLNKCVVTAREIAEIDPFIEVECYLEGVTADNMEAFMTDGGKLDILVDECDDLEIKISCRWMAKSLHIPVVMETSDRGMLDIERFDLDHDRPLLHGLLRDIPEERLKKITEQDRIPMVMAIVDIMNSSPRTRASLLEVGQSISTWPQLASSVTLGGGVVADVSRRILLEQFTDSGRYYVDLEEIVSNKIPQAFPAIALNPNQPFEIESAIRLIDGLQLRSADLVNENDIRQIVEAAGYAPSSGNNQPWKWVYRANRLHLFHDAFRSFAFSNYQDMAAHLALGAAYENAILKSNELGYRTRSSLFPLSDHPELIAIIEFSNSDFPGNDKIFGGKLSSAIPFRSTNRSLGQPYELSESERTALVRAVESVQSGKLGFITDRNAIREIGKVVAESELLALLNPGGHLEFFEKNIRWSVNEHSTSDDGISIESMSIPPPLRSAFSLLRDKKIAQTLQTFDGGNAFSNYTQFSVGSASSLAYISFPRSEPHRFFYGGIAAQCFWLQAEQLNLAVQPLLSPLFLFARLDSGEGLAKAEKEKLQGLEKIFRTIINLDKNLDEVFLFKISKADSATIRTKRLPLNEILFMVNDVI